MAETKTPTLKIDGELAIAAPAKPTVDMGLAGAAAVNEHMRGAVKADYFAAIDAWPLMTAAAPAGALAAVLEMRAALVAARDALCEDGHTGELPVSDSYSPCEACQAVARADAVLARVGVVPDA